VTPRTLTINSLLDTRSRLKLHGTGIIALVFVAIYGKLICPFIDTLNTFELVFNLLLVFIAQSIFREVLIWRWGVRPGQRSLARHGYYLAIVTWLFAGLIALLVHDIRYANFPLASHAKLLSGYWLLGAGILSQLEYLLLERSARALDSRVTISHLEKITQRILEGYFLFTLTPSLAMILLVIRYRWEGFVQAGVEIEIAFLGGFFVIMALVVATRYGQGLRADAAAVLEGTQRIEQGERGITLDTSRPDEIGQVASGINNMCRELENQNSQLALQLDEMEAMTHVSLAMSSISPVDQVLNLIVDNAKKVVHADASSLMLLNHDTQQLHFHVTKGRAAEVLQGQTVAIGTGISGTCAATGESILVEDAYADSRFAASYDQKTGFKTRTLLTVPMLSKGKVIGVIQALNKTDNRLFTPYDLHLLESFSAQAAVTLENARLYDESLQLTDDLREALENERRLSIEKDKMGAFIPRTVVDAIARSREEVLALGGRTVNATILFSDIQGFTALAESLHPQNVITFLNEYMTAMTEIIQQEGGIIDKFLGDGIMAIFTADECKKHELRAARAALKMQARLRNVKEHWSKDPATKTLMIRIGINTGEVVAGNVGSQTRMEYTVIGDNVNVAARIESACQPGSVLISQSTYEPIKQHIIATAREPIQVKNRQKPVHTYEVTNLAKNPKQN